MKFRTEYKIAEKQNQFGKPVCPVYVGVEMRCFVCNLGVHVYQEFKLM